jgi:hypothetical protein
MPLKREYLGLDRPPLVGAADYLLNRWADGAAANLRHVIVVVPGNRAGRRLLEILVEQCERRRLVLTPPLIETVGQLPEQLYRPRFPFASELTQRLVWAEALRAMPVESLAPVIPRPPQRDEIERWMELGDLLRRQHQELAADGLDFEAVAAQGPRLDDFVDTQRWNVLHELQQDYLRRLDDLQLWDVQKARLVAVEQRECATDREIVLVGTVDMNVTLRKMLDQVADRVTGLVFGLEEWRDRFDEYGCLVPEQWTTAPVGIQSDQVVIVDGPAEQAAAVRRLMAEFDGDYGSDEVVIGVPDEGLVPDIQRVLASSQVTARWGPGPLVTDLPLIHLIRTVGRYLDLGRYVDFAALLRHTDIGEWLARSGIEASVLDELDKYYQDHLPYHLTGDWLGGPQRYLELRAAWQAIQTLLAGLRQAPRPIADWRSPILELLAEVYGDRELDRGNSSDRLTLEACEAVRDALDDQAQVPASFMPTATASTAIRWLIDELQRTTAPAAADPHSVEMLGWLELPLDDAPALIVTTFNEGFVPSSVNSDLFLPNSLRRQLGITDNDRRFARDAYAVGVLVAVRESLHFIVAGHNREGDPLVPSRLLFAVDGVTAAQRASEYFKRPAEVPKNSLEGSANDSNTVRLEIPRPRPLTKPVTELSVTSLRDYKACPYRFYLRHVLHLESIDDDAQEMDGRVFGTLAHDVLRIFGAHPARDSSDVQEVAGVLDRALDESVRRLFGRQSQPAVRVQIEQLRIRFKELAAKQAAWCAAGWRIEFTELSPPKDQPAVLEVDGVPFYLRGRIDRIDFHAAKGERIIWDYKTSDSAQTPQATHCQKGEWIDWQLPLYRHLAHATGITGPLKLGYINLPKDTRKTEMIVAEWDEAMLAEADRTACDIIRCVRREEFWPPTRPAPDFAEDFAAICQDGVLGRD